MVTRGFLHPTSPGFQTVHPNSVLRAFALSVSYARKHMFMIQLLTSFRSYMTPSQRYLP